MPRYEVRRAETGWQVVDSHIDRPVTLSLSLTDTTPFQHTAERYCDKLNKCAEVLAIDRLDT